MRPPNERPTGGTWGWPAPTTVPQQMPDRQTNADVPVLLGPDGKTPILVRRPRPIGFRPERAER